ncbi:MAG: hypothetical protein OHK0031_08820 [Anaerolineales bacterium]
MNLRHFWPLSRFRVFALISLLISLAYLAQNVFLWGGEENVIFVNDNVTPFLAMFATLFALALWNETSWDKTSSLVWGSFSLGLTLWTVAEIIWALYSFVQQEIPYPSMADVLWILGYPAFFISFLLRYRGLRVHATRPQTFFVTLFSAASALFLFFLLFWPLLQTLTGSFVAEGILASAYPLIDLPLISLTIMIALALSGGKFSSPWAWLAVSFFLRTLSDIGFAYGTWTQSYYPDGALNNLSIFVDFTYNVSYIFIFLGLYRQQTLTTEAEKNIRVEKVELEHNYSVNVLLFTDGNDNLISISPNYLKLTGQPEQTRLSGQPVWQALEMEPERFAEFKEALLKHGQVIEFPISLAQQEGAGRTASLSGLMTRSEQREFNGMNLLMRVHIQSEENQLGQYELDKDQRELAYSMLAALGLEKSIGQQELKAYFYGEVRALYQLMLNTNGQQFAENLMGILNLTCIQHNWAVTISGGEIALPRGRQELESADLRFLLETLRDYANKALGPDLVKDSLLKLQAQLSQNILNTAHSNDLLPRF